MQSSKLFLAFLLITIFNGCHYDAVQPLKESTWEVVPLAQPLDQLLLGNIYFSTEQTGYIVAQTPGFDHSVLLTTEDGGDTWLMDTIRIKNIKVGGLIGKFNNALYIVGYPPTANEPDYLDVFKSIDGGATWEFESNGGGFFNKDYFISDVNRLRFAYDKILKSSDNGSTWNIVNNGCEAANMTGITFPSQNIGYIYGVYLYCIDYGSPLYQKGFVLKTIDGGESWRKLSLDVGSVLSIYFVNDLVGFLFTLSKELFKTVNGGDSWVRINSSVPQRGERVQSYFISPKEGYLFAEFDGGEIIYHTVDGVLTWTGQCSHSDERFRQI